MYLKIWNDLTLLTVFLGIGSSWNLTQFTSSTNNSNFAGTEHSSKLKKIPKNSANEDEENFSGLKSALPIKINGSYLGSNENINHLNCLDQSIKQRRRSLRETTPIKISGTEFVREIEQDESFYSINAPFGPILPEGRRPGEMCGHKKRFIPEKEAATDFIESCAQNITEQCQDTESSLETVITNMKSTLKSLKTNVTCNTLKEINREVTPFDLPDLDPLTSHGEEVVSAPHLQVLTDTERKGPAALPNIPSMSPSTDNQKKQSSKPNSCVIREKMTASPNWKSRGQKKKSSFKNTISYLLSKALDDGSHLDSESIDLPEESILSSSTSATSFTLQGDDDTSLGDVSLEVDLEDELDNVATDGATSVTGDTDSYSWYFDMEKCEPNENHYKEKGTDPRENLSFENKYSEQEENHLEKETYNETIDKFSFGDIDQTPEVEIVTKSVLDTADQTGNEMRLDMTDFNMILQR